MIRHVARLIPLAAPVLFLGCGPAAGSGRPGASGGTPAASGPSIAGTYQFAYRALNDGTRQEPPMVDGLMTFTDGYYTVNVMEHDAQGHVVVMSSVSRYSLTDSLFTEHLQFHYWTTLGQKGNGTVEHGLEKSAPLTIGADGTISFVEPLVGVLLVFTADSATVTMQNAFVDHLVRVGRGSGR